MRFLLNHTIDRGQFESPFNTPNQVVHAKTRGNNKNSMKVSHNPNGDGGGTSSLIEESLSLNTPTNAV